MNQITRSTAIDILCRLLNLGVGRVTGLGQRLADAGLLPRAVGRNVPALCSRELCRLAIAAIADNGLGAAPQMVETFENLETENGVTLGGTLESAFRGDIAVDDIAIQISPAAALINVGGKRLIFGSKLQGGAAVKIIHIPANVMRAIALEFREKRPTH